MLQLPEPKNRSATIVFHYCIILVQHSKNLIGVRHSTSRAYQSTIAIYLHIQGRYTPMSQTCFSISLRWLRIIVCAHVVYNAFSHAAIFFRTRCHMFMVHITWTSSTLILDQWTRNRWVYQRLKDIHCVQNWGVLQNGMWLIDRSSKLPSSSLWLISDSMHAPTAMLQFRVRLLRHRIIHGKYSQADIICMIDKSNYLIFQESHALSRVHPLYIDPDPTSRLHDRHQSIP